MYSVQSNQFMQQLTQLTCGVVATVTNSKVRPSPRAAQKFQKLTSDGLNKGSTHDCNRKSKSVINDAAWAWARPEEIVSQTVKDVKYALNPFLNVGVSQRTSTIPAVFQNEKNLEKFVSDIATKILRDRSNLLLKENELFQKIWTDVSQAVSYSFNSPFAGWSKQFSRASDNLVIQGTQKRFYHSSFNNGISCYKSYGSFELDRKYGPVGLLTSHHLQNFLKTQNRTFKTRRDMEAAKLRNPSLISRLRERLFANKDTNPPATPPTSEKLKTMITDVPQGEADKLKIAFAEGYLSGHGTGGGEKSRTYKWLRTVQQILAIAVFTAILASLMGNFGGGMFRVSVGSGNEVLPEDINITFDDVKGVDEAKQELQEIVEFLKNPMKFASLGGKLPKGVLLVGPPGTGKTLLARAVAGEAGVPFFHAAGPEFDEILVGQGARRVRDLFKAAKLKAPCVVFIDEIDSVGSKRTNSVLHPYANQTINQLLSEMDGFRQNEGVIVLGATNRREDLDKALLRPGRFDVEVPVPTPEYNGRKEIIEYYLSKIKLADDVDVDVLARGTTGFTGADLENMINQAALKAAIEGADNVGKKHLDFARDKVIMGPARKNRIPDEEANKITAYHEAGHAIASFYTKDSNPIHKVTIIPRGMSLGHTAYIPDKEHYHMTKSQLMATMDSLMGGRAAEELIFGMDKITSGASSDFQQATNIATMMVKQWGMSDRVGFRTVEGKQSVITVNDLGPQTSELIDAEIKRILQESYDRAKNILKSHSKEHRALAEALLKYETLDADDVKAILAGKPPSVTLMKLEKPSNPFSPKSSGDISGQKRLHPC